jgi:hypothetical protein
VQRILLGDNQFFGINHMSEEKARSQAIRFQNTDAIMEVIDAAYDEGIRVFMCTTHNRIKEIGDRLRADPARYAGFEFYPCMPYAHKYADAVTERGMVNALLDFLPERNKAGRLLKGALSVARKDLEGIAELLVEAEMKPFRGLRTPVVFLQNVVTDLLLGLGAHHALEVFANIVKRNVGAEPGFITMNLVRLLDALDEIGLENPIVCANINRSGFRVSGGLAAYEDAIANRKFRPIAMSVFASGAIPPREAIKYVCDQPQIEAIVFGASSRGNIRETKRLIDELTVSGAAA